MSNKAKLIKGNAFGLRGPLVTVEVSLPSHPSTDVSLICESVIEFFDVPPIALSHLHAQPISINNILELLFIIESHINTSVVEHGRILKTSIADTNEVLTYELVLPTDHHRFTLYVLDYLTVLVSSLTSNKKNSLATKVNDLKVKLNTAIKQLKLRYGEGVNRKRIIQIAHALNLDFRYLDKEVLLVGTGKNAQCFNSTFTEQTSFIACSTARSKINTSMWLKQHGLPAPQHIIVKSLQETLKAAEILGYPVVLKPLNLDGGRGVFSGIENAADLRKFHSEAVKFSKSLMVEKHVFGNDYRITVHQGQVVKAVLRQPGGVTGDGVNTISELVSQALQNSELGRSKDKCISLDDEALFLLDKAGLNPQTILKKGEFFALRSRANISTGGKTFDVLPIIHPDNKRLAERATKAIRLDLAGVDLICKDISQSWLKIGATIIEINAQPQVSFIHSPNFYHELLLNSIHAPRRLFTILLICPVINESIQAYVDDIVANLIERDHDVYYSNQKGVWLNHTRMGTDLLGGYTVAKQAELSSESSASVVVMSMDEVEKSGSPWRKLDHIAVINTSDNQEQSNKIYQRVKDLFSTQANAIHILEQNHQDNSGKSFDWLSKEFED